MKVRSRYECLIYIPAMSKPEIEQQALQWRSDYLNIIHKPGKLRINPANMVWDFLQQRAKIDLILGEELIDLVHGEQIKGVTVPMPDGRSLIYIDKKEVGQPSETFTIAHEIGHCLLHVPLVQQRLQVAKASKYEDRLFLAMTFPRFSTSEKSSKIGEHQANYFAANLLMPTQLFRRQFALRLGTEVADYPKLAKLFASDIAAIGRRYPRCTEQHALAILIADMVSPDFALSLCKEFGVSADCCAYRIESLGLLTPLGASTNHAQQVSHTSLL